MTNSMNQDLIRLSVSITSQRDDVWFVPRFGQSQPIDLIVDALKNKLYETVKDVGPNFISTEKKVYYLNDESLETAESDFKMYVEIEIVDSLETDYSPIVVEHIEP